MTEQEYIDARDKAKISDAIKILSDVIPENSSIIGENYFRKMMWYLCEWEEQFSNLFKGKIKIEEE